MVQLLVAARFFEHCTRFTLQRSDLVCNDLELGAGAGIDHRVGLANLARQINQVSRRRKPAHRIRRRMIGPAVTRRTRFVVLISHGSYNSPPYAGSPLAVAKSLTMIVTSQSW